MGSNECVPNHCAPADTIPELADKVSHQTLADIQTTKAVKPMSEKIFPCLTKEQAGAIVKKLQAASWPSPAPEIDVQVFSFDVHAILPLAHPNPDILRLQVKIGQITYTGTVRMDVNDIRKTQLTPPFERADVKNIAVQSLLAAFNNELSFVLLNLIERATDAALSRPLAQTTEPETQQD